MPPPESPPRRARPRVPPPFLEPTFSPARHALRLASRAPSPRAAALAELRALRDDIAAHLRAAAPAWPRLAPALARLTAALRATQSASALRRALAALSPRDDYPARMALVVARAASLSATVSLAAAARDFADLLRVVDAAPPPRAPPRVLPHAAALHRARAAAHAPPLAAVRALDDARAALDARHAFLLARLQRALVTRVYTAAVPFARPAPHSSTFSASSAHPATSPPTQSPPTHTPPAAVCPDLARAIDTLAGPGAAAKLLSASAATRIVALIRDAVLSECTTPARTVASLASSSFTAAPTNSPTSFGSEHVFREPAPSRAACATVFERVRFLMTGVLRRLSALADDVADDMPDLSEAVRSVWTTMEGVLVLFIQALLGFPTTRFSADTAEPGGISLLPSFSRRSDVDTVCTWELERGQSSLDSFATLVNSVPTLSPSIYNLEVVYGPLQLFIMNSSRLQESWKEKQTEIAAPLPGLLSRAVDLFVTTVQQDVKRYMDDAFGNRAGTLLQPLSLRQRSSHHSSQSYVLPPLPQTQVLIDVIASCLSLAVAVPSVAARLGEVINSEVILPFSDRAIYALKLAASWTDAGALVHELTGIAEESLLPNGTGAKRPAKRKAPKNGTAMAVASYKTVRRNPDLTAQCLATICEKRKQPWNAATHLLVESEWNAVVRLVATAKLIISELESCAGKKTDATSRSPSVSASGFTETYEAPKQSGTLRGLLLERGISSRLHGTVVEAIQKTQQGCRVLRDDVVERGMVLLHSEVTLHCFSEVVRSLGKELSNYNGNTGSSGSLESVGEVQEDEKTNGKGLSRPSSIFKASQIQLSDVDRESDEFSHAMNEFDEFGDRITTANETVNDTEIEEYGFPNSLLLEHPDWKVPNDEATREKIEGVSFAQAAPQAVTKSDQKVMDLGRDCGEHLRQKDMCIKDNLSGSDRDFIFSQADAGVALGIRFSGKTRGRGDRDVATGARIFLDAVATVAAETVGWPVVESDYSVTEGASQSASECRTLLYSAGLL